MSKDQTINLICFNKEKLLEYQAPKVLQQCSNHGTSKQNSNMEREQQYQPKEDENLCFLKQEKIKGKMQFHMFPPKDHLNLCGGGSTNLNKA